MKRGLQFGRGGKKKRLMCEVPNIVFQRALPAKSGIPGAPGAPRPRGFRAEVGEPGGPGAAPAEASSGKSPPSPGGGRQVRGPATVAVSRGSVSSMLPSSDHRLGVGRGGGWGGKGTKT